MFETNPREDKSKTQTDSLCTSSTPNLQHVFFSFESLHVQGTSLIRFDNPLVCSLCQDQHTTSSHLNLVSVRLTLSHTIHPQVSSLFHLHSLNLPVSMSRGFWISTDQIKVDGLQVCLMVIDVHT